MNFDEAMRDIREYLEAQEDEYFEEKGTTREAVMADTDRLAWCAREHKKCVEAYGVDREFSCKDACDKAPGAVPPAVKKSVLCRCKRAGSETDTAVPFEELKAGDTVYVRGIPHELAETRRAISRRKWRAAARPWMSSRVTPPTSWPKTSWMRISPERGGAK